MKHSLPMCLLSRRGLHSVVHQFQQSFHPLGIPSPVILPYPPSPSVPGFTSPPILDSVVNNFHPSFVSPLRCHTCLGKLHSWWIPPLPTLHLPHELQKSSTQHTDCSIYLHDSNLMGSPTTASNHPLPVWLTLSPLWAWVTLTHLLSVLTYPTLLLHSYFS